jgi:hypothetical protein
MKKIYQLVTLLLLLSIHFGCKNSNLEKMLNESAKNKSTTTPSEILNDPNRVVSFKEDIQPILNTNCGTNRSSCHSSASASSGISLSDHASVVQIQDDGGLFLSSISHDGNASKMPKGGAKLDDNTILLIKRWVEDKMLNN